MSGSSEEDLRGNYLGDGFLDCDGGARLFDQPGFPFQLSPPNVHCSRVVEESIQINENRESLKRKLLLRRTLPELVDQGIYPPLNVPPAFADRQRHLQRAQTGDRLRQKLKERPDRELLVEHHILEDTSVLVDRSLQDKQRLLKRSRLQSDLSGRLASRPGPLELVTKNILQTDPQLKDGLLEGKIPFTRTTEVDDPVRRFYYPELHQGEEDDFEFGLDSIRSGNSIDFSALVSTSDDSLPDSICLTPTECSSEQTVVAPYFIPSPPDSFSIMPPKSSSIAPNIPPAPDIMPLLRGEKFHFSSPQLPPAPVFNFIPSLPSVLLQLKQAPSSGDLASPADGPTSTAGSVSKKTTKKPKNKNITKSKMIKFHEYKGPPNAVRTSSKLRAELPVPCEPEASTSTSYGVLLEQQQLFLQWQLEFQQKALLSRQQSESTLSAAAGTIATPVAAQMSLSNSSASEVGTSGVFNFKQLSSLSSALSMAARTPSRIEDMKVADLKSECKRLSLPSHGSKPQLIERLSPHLGKINLNAGHSREPVVSFRSSDSSLSGSSEVTSPVSASLDSSFAGSQFGILPAQKSVVPVTMDAAPPRPSSILPMDVDQNVGQSSSGFIRPAPATFILVQASHHLSQTPQKLNQIPYGGMSLKDQIRPQIFSITRPASMPSNSFNSSQVGNMSVSQPVMLLTHPMEAPRVIKSEEQRPALTAHPAIQPVRPVQSAGWLRPESISSEEMVVRQQQVIASLEHSLQEYQKKLVWTQQKAFLQEIQLSGLSQDDASSSGINPFSEKGDTSAVALSRDNGVCNRMLFTQSQPQIPYDLNSNGNSTVLNVGSQVPSYSPILHAATDPLLSISPSTSSYANSAVADNYPGLSSVVSSQCNSLDDIIDVLYKKGDLIMPAGDSVVLASGLKDSSVADNDDKPMFFLPDSDVSDLISGLQMDSSTYSAVGNSFLFDSRTLAASSNSSLPVEYARCNDIQGMDMCIAKSEASSVNGSLNAADGGGLFAFGNMEWSDLDLDLMSAQMDIVQSSLDDTYKANKNFDLGISDIDWLSRNSDVAAPVAATSACPSQSVVASSAAPFPGNEYLPLLRPGEELDFFNCDGSDPFGTADLTMMMNFETLLGAQVSKT